MANCGTITVDTGGGTGGCQTDGDCPSGQVCQSGTCVDDPTDGGDNGDGGDGGRRLALAAGAGLVGLGTVAFVASRDDRRR